MEFLHFLSSELAAVTRAVVRAGKMSTLIWRKSIRLFLVTTVTLVTKVTVVKTSMIFNYLIQDLSFLIVFFVM